MTNHGFIKVASAIPVVKVADCSYNIGRMADLIMQADKEGVRILSFPELTITAYTCGDLFAQQLLLQQAERALAELVQRTAHTGVACIVGMPVAVNAALYNTAVVFKSGKIYGVVPKTYLPNYREFYERRWFTSALDLRVDSVRLCGQELPISANLLFHTCGVCFGIEICEDLWAPIPPGCNLAMRGAELLFNLSADNEGAGKLAYVHSLVGQQSARCLAGYIFTSCGFGESSTDVVFGGNGMIYENGLLLNKSERFLMESQLVISEVDVDRLRAERRVNTTFSANAGNIAGAAPKSIYLDATDEEGANETPFSLTRTIHPHPFVPEEKKMDECCEEILNIQAVGLAQRLMHTGCRTVVIGVSGGLDSTLALLVCVRTFDKLNLPRKGIIGITMPGFGTTGRTYTNAIDLMKSLGITIREISIKQACIQHFEDIGHDINRHDATYENAQARERTQILMDIANQTSGIVVGTGDLSELALGWATYNGDQMSMYGVNAGIPKTLITALVGWVAHNESDAEIGRLLLDIVDTPISPELTPADDNGDIKQKTEDLVGPYELHDFFIYYFLRHGFSPSKILYLAVHAFEGSYEKEVIKKWLAVFIRRFFSQQFKRSCMPDGPKVGSVSLSPRGDWRMPSDASAKEWLDEIAGS